MFFFFSSRRRHTRWPRDWSSDVCSSDLHHGGDHGALTRGQGRANEALTGQAARGTRGGDDGVVALFERGQLLALIEVRKDSEIVGAVVVEDDSRHDGKPHE